MVRDAFPIIILNLSNNIYVSTCWVKTSPLQQKHTQPQSHFISGFAMSLTRLTLAHLQKIRVPFLLNWPGLLKFSMLQVLKVHHGNGVRRSDLASICTGLSHLEDLAPKKKRHSADSAGQIFQRSRKSVKRLSAKFTSTWGPAPHMMGTLTKQSGSSWTWAEGSYSPLNFEQSFHRGKATWSRNLKRTWNTERNTGHLCDMSKTWNSSNFLLSQWAV